MNREKDIERKKDRQIFKQSKASGVMDLVRKAKIHKTEKYYII